MNELLDIITKAVKREEKTKPYDTSAKVTRVDGDTAWVHIDGGVAETPVKKTINAIEGDTVQVRVSGGTAFLIGNGTRPPTDDSTANHAVNIANTVQNDITVLNTVVAENIEATNAKFTTVEADTAKIHNLTADQLTATVGYIGDLNADNISAQDIIADHATITSLDVESINAATGYIEDLTSENITAQNIIADHETVGSLDANYAHITDGVIDNAKIGYADVDDLDAHYAEIDLANVNNAWIEYGAIKKAEVFDENVFDLSGDHATLSRIDASKINVANLRADNLVVRRINGQPVVGGYTLIDSNSPGYSSKNPQALGWYEFVNAQWVLSTDTTVDMTKAYYQTGNEVSLYDQAYIDGLEDDLQQQIDGAVETFTGSVVPTLTNYPYTDWYDTSVTPVHDERAKHVGDIYYVVNSASDENGYCYRFAYDNTTHAYSWVLIKDSDVTKALSDISDLQTFESTTTSWMDETDEGIETIRTNHTTLAGIVDKTVKESVQLWFTKANTTAPAKPNSTTYPNGVTDTSTAGNGWRCVVPAYNASYPNYFYCWQYKFVDDTFGWSAVVRDIAMGETQGMSRDAKNTADAALPASTFTSFESTTFKDVKDTVTEHSTKFTNMTSRLGLNSDGTGASTDIWAKESALETTVDGISTRVGKTETKLIGMYATSSTAAGTAAKVATITPTLPSGATWELSTGTIITVKFTNANTTSSPTLNVNSKGAKAIKTYANGNLTEAEYKWAAGSTFTFVYNGTNWLMQDSSVSVRMNSNETSISQTADSIISLASGNTTYTKPDGTTVTSAIGTTVSQTANNVLIKATRTGATMAEQQAGGTSAAALINVTPDTVKIAANHVEIDGTAVFNAVSDSSTASAAMLNSELEIGGRNILGYTGDFANWRLNSVYTTVSDGELSFNISGLTSNTFVRVFGWLLPNASELTGKTIVVSAEVYSDDWSTVESDRGDWHRSICLQMQYTNVAKWDKTSSYTGLRYRHGNFGDTSLWDVMPTTMTNGKWHRIVSKPILLPDDFTADVASGTGSEITIQPMLIRNGRVKFRHLKVEIGNKATDWTPAPEDVQAEIDAKKSVHTLTSTSTTGYTYAQLLTWSAEGYGEPDGSSWGATSTAGIKAGDTVRIAIPVSDMNLAKVYVVGTVVSITDSTHVKMISHGLDTTIIDGGNILTNSIGANQIKANAITANKIAIGDFNNYITVTENDADTLLNATEIVDGWLHKTSSTATNIFLSPALPNWVKSGDKYRVTGTVKAPATGSAIVVIYGRTVAGAANGNNAFTTKITAADTETEINGVITITNSNLIASPKANIAIVFCTTDGWTTNYQTGYCKNMKVERMSGGELIVDGSITANHLAANSITVGDMNQDAQDKVLNSNIEIGGRNLSLATGTSQTLTLSSGNYWFVPTIYTTSDYGKSLLTDTSNTRFTVSYDYSITGVTGNATLRMMLRYTSGGSYSIGTIISGEHPTISSGSSSGHASITFEPNSGSRTYGTDWMVMVYNTTAEKEAVANATLTISNFKFEIGNKATDWTEAPEDGINDNLLMDTQKMSSWYLASGASIDTTAEFGVITLNGTTANWNAQMDSRPLLRTSILDGTPLWLSFEYTASVATALHCMICGSAANEGMVDTTRTKYYGPAPTIPAASSWTRKVVSMPTALSELVNGSGDVNSLFVRFYNRTNSSTFKVRKLKLEHGASATNWTPSSEDQKTYITRIDDAGIRIHPSNTANNSVVINADGMEVFKGGTTDQYSVAKYGDTARVGKEGSGHTTIASTGMLVYGSNGTVELANIGYGSGNNSSGGTSSAPYYTFGEKLLNSSNGNYSVGEGYRFTASGWASHAEGYYTEASGASSHAEGDNSMARGSNSHAEGYSTLASGEDSHAGGTNTIASGDSQTAIGKFNIEDTTSLFIVGNGTSTGSANRSNAFKIDSTGDIYPRNIKMVDFVIEQDTSGNWRWRKWNSGIIEAWYLGQNVTYSGTNTAIALPHTLKKILCLTGNGVLNGSAFTPLTNLWCSTTSVYISFNATGTKLDNLSLYAVYTV